MISLLVLYQKGRCRSDTDLAEPSRNFIQKALGVPIMGRQLKNIYVFITEINKSNISILTLNTK